MTALVKIDRRGQVTIPARLRGQAGFADGDIIEARAETGRVILVPKRDEYTTAQRRAIDAEIAKAQKGPYHGPFTADEAVSFLKAAIKSKKPRRE